MTLRELANVFPGYVRLCIHTPDMARNVSAGEVLLNEDLSAAEVICAVPIQSYAVEVSIKLKEEIK